MTKRDLFWHVFQTSGHIGAYLLYSDYGRSEAVASHSDSRKLKSARPAQKDIVQSEFDRMENT